MEKRIQGRDLKHHERLTTNRSYVIVGGNIQVEARI